MRILFCVDSRNYRYESMGGVLSQTKHVVGRSMLNLSQKDINDFAPDLIIHNCPRKIDFHCNAATISALDIMKDPFSVIGNWDKNRLTNKYHSKSVYIGDPSLLGDRISKLILEDGLKILHDRPLPIIGYAGVCKPDEYQYFYHMAGFCPIQENDIARYRDIIISGGRISKESVDRSVRLELISSHTEYDRLSSLLTNAGLNELAKEIKTLKSTKVKELI